MALNWRGPFDQLIAAVTFTGRRGNWSEGDPIVFVAETGEILRFYPSTKTIQFQGYGQNEFQAELEVELGLKKNTLDFGG